MDMSCLVLLRTSWHPQVKKVQMDVCVPLGRHHCIFCGTKGQRGAYGESVRVTAAMNSWLHTPREQTG